MKGFPIANPLMLATVPPAPIMGTNAVMSGTAEGQRYVILKFDDQSGTKVVFMSPDSAKELADKIRAAASGLSLVNGNQP